MGIVPRPIATAVALIISLLFTPMSTSAISSEVLPTSASSCPNKCVCDMTVITCEGWIPSTVPETIKTVVLTEIEYEELENRSCFCNVIWDNVNNLTIKFTDEIVILDDDDLDCLSQLEAIALTPLANYAFLGFTEGAFSSLVNLATIHLSGWFVLMDHMNYMLNVKANLPKLTYLTLSKVRNPFKMDQDFINALFPRSLESLDISFNSNIRFQFRDDKGLCKTLTTVLMHDSRITQEYFPLRPCMSLNLVDISRTHDLSIRLQNAPCVNHSISLLNYFFYARIVRADELLTSTTSMHISHCILFLSDVVAELHFSRNVLPAFEFLFSSEVLLHIDLSHNNIKTINEKVFRNSQNLDKIDVSHNKLGEISSGKTNISMLFKNNTFLSSVDLTSNSLSRIPVETFLSNPQLKEIRLANNSFTEIHFTITHLVNLTTLDVRFNQIQLLDLQSVKAIDTLYKKQTNGQTLTNSVSGTLHVLLEGNPLSCDCTSLDFLEWVVASPVFNSDRQTYRCTSRGRQISLIDAGIDAAQEDCELAAQQLRTIILSTTFGVAGIASTVVAIFILRKRYKRFKLQNKLTDQLRLIQEENTGLKFPVFLSYCSDDAEFIAQHVRGPLQRHLREYTNIDRELVCEGDRHFIPGHNILSEMSRCVGESAVVLAVVSESFCKSYFCKLEIFEAKNTGKPVMLIMKEHVDVKKMDLTIKEIFMNNARAMFVEENGQLTIQPSWEKICEGIITLM